MEIERRFNCSKCGLCCLCIKDNPMLKSIADSLDDGSGACKYFDKETKLCTIYDDRPLICRVDDLYDCTDIKNKYTRTEWYKINHDACKEIKKKFEEDDNTER